jgi:hypothetical protein
VPGVNPAAVAIVTGLLAAVDVTPPGEDVILKDVAVPPVAAAVKGTDIIAPDLVAVPTVGVSGKAAIFAVPAEASLNLDPANPEALAFVTAISLCLS